MAGSQKSKRSLTRIAYARERCVAEKMEQYTPVIYHSLNRQAWIVIQPDGGMIVLCNEQQANSISQLVWLGLQVPTLFELHTAKLKQKLRLQRQQKSDQLSSDTCQTRQPQSR